jgi:hypothetical protein
MQLVYCYTTATSTDATDADASESEATRSLQTVGPEAREQICRVANAVGRCKLNSVDP